MSVVRLINASEKLVHQVGDTKFYYRRITSGHAAAIRRKYTNKGIFDGNKFGLEVLEQYLTGWDDVWDWQDKKVEFSTERIHYIPDGILAEVLEKISDSEGVTVEEASQDTEKGKTEKNS